jgi:excisionase family DNA binding protein
MGGRESPGTKSARVSATLGNSPLLTLKQAAQYAICIPRFLQKQIRIGNLRALKPSRKMVRIRLAELERFLES